MNQSFTIPGRLAGLNDYTDECRKGTVRRGGNVFCPANQMKKEQQEIVRAAIREAGLTPFEGHVRVVFEWHEPNARRDVDNVRFAAKFILDALVAEGVLKGDSQRYVQKLADVFTVDRDNPHITVDMEGD